MFSVFFYIGPTLSEFEATGFPTMEHAKSGITSDRVWFTNAIGEMVYLPMSIKQNSVAVITETV